MNNNENPFLNEINDLTRQAYSNKSNTVPLNNKANLDRFETDIFLHSKEEFSNNNTRINDLNDEILQLKEQLKVIPEKQGEIDTLTEKNQELENKLQGLQEALQDMKVKYNKLEYHNNSLLAQCADLETQNKLLESNLSETRLSVQKNLMKEDREETHEEEIKVNIQELKTILNNRLKSYHEKHIDGLIQSYQLDVKDSISKEDMKKLLLEVIHI